MRIPGQKTETDAKLLQEAKAGSEEAFVRLYQKYEPLIRRQASSLLSAQLEVEDLEQEGRLALLYAARSFRPEGGASFSTYVRVCVRHRMISAARRVRWFTTLFPEEWEALEHERLTFVSLAEGQAADPVERLVNRDEERRLTSRLQRVLTSLEYQVLQLHLEGYTYEETAARLGVAVKTVDNALQRVRRKLSAPSKT